MDQRITYNRYCRGARYSVSQEESTMEAKKGIPKSHLSEIMGDRKIKIADVLRCTNIGRNTCARVYQEKDMEKMTLGTFINLCDGLGVSLNELLEYHPEKRYNPETRECEEY